MSSFLQESGHQQRSPRGQVHVIVATPPWSAAMISAITSFGVRNPRRLRGRLLRLCSAAWICSLLHWLRSVPLGKNSRSKPLDAPMFVKRRGRGR